MAKNLIFFWAPYGFGFALDGLGLGGVRFRVDLCALGGGLPPGGGVSGFYLNRNLMVALGRLTPKS